MSGELSDTERRNEMKKRIEEISSAWGTECSTCKNWHLVDGDGSGSERLPVTYSACCPCFCHESNHRLLIYATGDNEFSLPHHIAFKIVDGNMVSLVYKLVSSRTVRKCMICKTITFESKFII